MNMLGWRLLCMAFSASLFPAHAADMERVPKAQAYCAKWGSYCYEWMFSRDKSLRFVAHGYEDGGLWTFYRRSPKGHYEQLFAVHPAMIDPQRPGQLFWGYAWDIDDVVLVSGRKALTLYATFDHKFKYDGNASPPENQHAIPYVLFTGTTKQPQMKVPADLPFAPTTPAQVHRRATAKR